MITDIFKKYLKGIFHKGMLLILKEYFTRVILSFSSPMCAIITCLNVIYTKFRCTMIIQPNKIWHLWVCACVIACQSGTGLHVLLCYRVQDIFEDSILKVVQQHCLFFSRQILENLFLPVSYLCSGRAYFRMIKCLGIRRFVKSVLYEKKDFLNLNKKYQNIQIRRIQPPLALLNCLSVLLQQ